MQKTAYENIKFVLIGLVTVFGIFSIILFLNGLDEGDAWGKMQAFYVAGFIISGFFISGMAFTNLRTKERFQKSPVNDRKADSRFLRCSSQIDRAANSSETGKLPSPKPALVINSIPRKPS